MITVCEIVQTCEACPSQWKGRTLNGKYVYVRYRWGFLTVGVGGTPDRAVLAGGNVYEAQLGDEYDGFMGPEDLVRHTVGHVQWAVQP